MKKNIPLTCLFCIVITGLQAQTMFVRPQTGAQAAYTITNIQKLTFSGDNMLVTPISGAAVTHSKTGNRYINFTDLTLATTSPQAVASTFYLYPNPVKEVLNITVAAQGQTIYNIAIITLDGRLVLQLNQTNSNLSQIAVSTLPQGMYLCKITSGDKTQTLKFIKQ